MSKISITVHAYNSVDVIEQDITDNIQSAAELLQKWPVIWIDITGAAYSEQVPQLLQLLYAKPVDLQQLQASDQSPSLRFITKDLIQIENVHYYAADGTFLIYNFILGEKFLLSYSVHPSTAIQHVPSVHKSKLLVEHQSGPDYVLYHVLTNIFQSYLQTTRQFGDTIDTTEATLVVDPQKFSVNTLFAMRRQLTIFKRNLYLQRDVISQLAAKHPAAAHKLIQPENRTFYSESKKRLDDLSDLLESYMEHNRGLLDIYFSSTSNQMNQVMKTLTIFSAVFLPLSFLAGLWGMNFDFAVSHLNMPELHWKYGYPTALAIMLAVACGLIIIFKKVGWLSRKKTL